MKGLLENHLNVAALDNDETNKRFTFLFRFEEEFRIPLVKRQRFNSSEAEGLLVICRGCCRRGTNGHGTGFPSTLPMPWGLRKHQQGEGRQLWEAQCRAGEQHCAPTWGLALVWRAAVLDGTGQCKAHFYGTRALGGYLACPNPGNGCCCALSSTHCPARMIFFFFLNQSQGKMNGKQLSTLPLPTVHLHLMTHWFLLYVFPASFVYFRKQPLKHTGSFGSRRSRAATC